MQDSSSSRNNSASTYIREVMICSRCMCKEQKECHNQVVIREEFIINVRTVKSFLVGPMC